MLKKTKKKLCNQPVHWVFQGIAVKGNASLKTSKENTERLLLKRKTIKKNFNRMKRNFSAKMSTYLYNSIWQHLQLKKVACQ